MSSQIDYPPTPLTRLKRAADRGHYDRATVHAILDEALLCHLGFSLNGQPVVLPTIHARIDDVVYVHGSSANRMLRSIRDGDGVDACVAVTLVDGLVLARSAFHHSMNFRSAVVFGRATEVTDPDEKNTALERLVEHVAPGRAADVRAPNEKELLRTLVLRVPIDQASAKIRSGPPNDEDEDYALDVWAGVLPLSTHVGPPVADPRLRAGIEPEAAVRDWHRDPGTGGTA